MTTRFLDLNRTDPMLEELILASPNAQILIDQVRLAIAAAMDTPSYRPESGPVERREWVVFGPGLCTVQRGGRLLRNPRLRVETKRKQLARKINKQLEFEVLKSGIGPIAAPEAQPIGGLGDRVRPHIPFRGFRHFELALRRIDFESSLPTYFRVADIRLMTPVLARTSFACAVGHLTQAVLHPDLASQGPRVGELARGIEHLDNLAPEVLSYEVSALQHARTLAEHVGFRSSSLLGLANDLVQTLADNKASKHRLAKRGVPTENFRDIVLEDSRIDSSRLLQIADAMSAAYQPTIPPRKKGWVEWGHSLRR